ncbi:MAG: hypothetical protein COA42_22260 [Alteromonadaceae bacterium]|nr:MAG: hypothetical protein COA42_22260 [Alteromonadaceae bacterium]
MEITEEDLYGQNYLGKAEFTALLREKGLVKNSVKTELYNDMLVRHNRFVDRHCARSEHELYLKKAVGELLVLLDDLGEEKCMHIHCFFKPNYKYSLYIHAKTGNVLAAIRGYDITKSTTEEWESIWWAKSRQLK